MKKYPVALALLALACTQEKTVTVTDPFSAANVHLKGGSNAEPSFNDGGLSLSGSGELSGLGNGDVLITLSATADVLSTCTNQGGNQAPGQNPAPITVTGTLTIPDAQIKNGNTPFAVVTQEPPTVIPGAPDCPNPNWTEAIEDLLFTSATITVEQPVGTTVFTVVCTISPPSSGGSVRRQDVVCS